MIPKLGEDFWGIGLVEVLFKMVVVILNLCLGASITLHDVLHNFRASRRIGTTSLEAKLIQHLTAMS